MQKKKIVLPYKLLIYDIETGLLNVNLFRLGEQRVNHNQLTALSNVTPIICICAKWYGKSKVYTFKGPTAVEEFDKLARKADVCLGKNSDSFDVKHINTQRMLQGLKPFPEWMDRREDLEKQMRKYFNFPSQSLDYISKLFGLGGKRKMEFSDWVDIHNLDVLTKVSSAGRTLNSHQTKLLFGDIICNIVSNGRKALKKMLNYCPKDVLDTEAALVKVLPYVKLKYNATASMDGHGCTTCGSGDLVPTETVTAGKIKYQLFECLSHKGYAGRATWFYKKGSHSKTYSKMG